MLRLKNRMSQQASRTRDIKNRCVFLVALSKVVGKINIGITKALKRKVLLFFVEPEKRFMLNTFNSNTTHLLFILLLQPGNILVPIRAIRVVMVYLGNAQVSTLYGTP